MPIIAESRILTLSPILQFFIRTLFPIIQLDPITTFDSIMVLWPTIEFFPILTFSLIKTFFPNLIVLNNLIFGRLRLKSTASLRELG